MAFEKKEAKVYLLNIGMYIIPLNEKIHFPEYNKVMYKRPERIEEFRLCSRVYLVFNEDCIEGISKRIANRKSKYRQVRNN